MKRLLAAGGAIAAILLGSMAQPTAVRAQEPAPGPFRLAPAQLAIWNDPAFQRRFAESYIAESEIEPRVTAEERERMQEILALVSTDEIEKALEVLDKETADNPAASAVFDFTLANIHFQKEEFDRAVVSYDVAVTKYPKFRRAWKNLGLIHVRRGDFAKALPALTKVVELGGGDAVTYGLLGYAYSSTENFVPAESAYRMAILMDPATLDWKMGLARSFFKQERYGEAAALCGHLIAENPDRGDLWLLQANAYLGMGQPMKAANVFEIVDHLGKSTPESLAMLGDIYVNEELHALAANSYAKAAEADPEGSVQRAVRAARILSARGAYGETARLVEFAEARSGDSLDAETRKELLKLRGRIAVAQGAGEEEVRVLEEIVELDPLDGEALILLGQHSNRKGDKEKAVFYYERAAAMEPFEADAKVRHAQLLVADGKYSDALPLLRRAQQIKHRENIEDYLEQVERLAKTR